MKIKDKLSREFAKEYAEERKKHFPNLNPGAFDNESTFIAIGYLEGFDKAKKMAIQIMSDTPYASFRLCDLGEFDDE